MNKLWEANFFFSHVHVPLVVSVFYFVSFAVLHSYILSIPVGVNYVFASRSWKYLSLLAAGSSVIFFAIVKLKGGGKLEFRNSTEKISRGDFLLLLLPLTPVVQYIINNQDILSPLGSLSVLATFVVFSGFYVFAIPAFLGCVGSTRTWISLGLAFVFTITSMASLSHSYAWLDQGNLEIQLMFSGAVFLVTWLLFGLNERKVLRLLISVAFVTHSTTQLLTSDDWKDGSSQPDAANRLLSIIEERKPVITPSIYLLVYDSYVANETLLAYGIDNRSQEEYLKELGFKLYPHTYSVDNGSVGTMSRVLDASTDFHGSARSGVSGDGTIQNALSRFGYKTYGLFPTDYFFLDIEPTYDYFVPGRPSSPDILSRAILMGEFKFDVGFNTLPSEQFIETKHRIFGGASGPMFVYTHSLLPGHSQNSGVCRPEETDLFEIRLTSANSEMRLDVERIIKKDPGAIAIIAGDHGPYLTKNCISIENGYDESEISRLDIQDRYGTFLAIKWPTEDSSKYDDITVLQDLFPAIFAYLFTDERILESKIDPSTLSTIVRVQNGIIYGGIHDGEPLFLAGR